MLTDKRGWGSYLKAFAELLSWLPLLKLLTTVAIKVCNTYICQRYGKNERSIYQGY